MLVETMFTGFRKDAARKPKGSSKRIEDKWQLVIDRIDAWLEVLSGAPIKGVQRLSKLDGDSRLVWLKYSNQNVPLTSSGDLVGEIDPAQDEAGFWHWMRERVQAGDYDSGILQIAEATARRMKDARNA